MPTKSLEENAELAQAVYCTSNELLDKPEFVEHILTGKEQLDLIKGTLVPLGYAELRSLDYDTGSYRGPELNVVWLHPTAKQHLDEFGDEYLRCLHVVKRLTGDEFFHFLQTRRK
jgi:hypothetical protein